jgi:hypothetical protein
LISGDASGYGRHGRPIRRRRSSEEAVFMPQPPRPEVAELLRFDPDWVTDPVPPWLLQYLNRSQLVQVAKIRQQLHINVLEHQLEAAQKSLEVIGKIGG